MESGQLHPRLVGETLNNQDYAVLYDLARLAETWRVASGAEEFSVAVSEIYIFRRFGAKVAVGISSAEFEAFLAGDFRLDTVIPMPGSEASFLPYDHVEPKLQWKTMPAESPYEYEHLILVGTRYANGAIDSTVLAYSEAEWDAFLDGAKHDEFDMNERGFVHDDEAARHRYITRQSIDSGTQMQFETGTVGDVEDLIA